MSDDAMPTIRPLARSTATNCPSGNVRMCAEKCAQYRSRHRARAWGRVGDGHGAAIGSEAAAVREEIRQMGGRAGLDHR